MAQHRLSHSPLTIHEVFKQLCIDDPRIQQYRFGDFAEGEQFAGNEFPLMMIDITAGEMSKTGTQAMVEWSVSLACFTMRRKDWTGLAEAQADLYNILFDTILRIKSDDQLRSWGWSFDKNAKQKFSIYDRTNRAELTCVLAELQFSTPVAMSPCDLLPGALPDEGLAYSGTPSVPASYLTCATLSGCSVIQSILVDIAAISGTTGESTFVQEGTNIVTGGTAYRPVISTVDDPTFNTIYATNIEVTDFINGTKISGGTAYFNRYLSGGTDLSLLIASATTNVIAGTNTSIGGTIHKPTVNVVPSPSFTTVSATTFVSGSTDISTYFRPSTFVQPGTNITTGGTAYRPVISTIDSPEFFSLTVSTDLTVLNNIDALSMTASSIVVDELGAIYFAASGAIYSGTTDLGDLFGPSTFVQAGANVLTGGTPARPLIYLNEDVEFSNVSVSELIDAEHIQTNSLYAISFSAGTIHSGSTDVGSMITSKQPLDSTLSALSSLTPTQIRAYLGIEVPITLVTNLQLANQAAALQFVTATLGQASTQANLSGYSQIRMVMHVSSASVAASPKVIIRYLPSFSNVQADYLDIGTSEVSVSLTTFGTFNSGWIDLAAGAKADVSIRAVMQGGNGTSDPVIGNLTIYLR